METGGPLHRMRFLMGYLIDLPSDESAPLLRPTHRRAHCVVGLCGLAGKHILREATRPVITDTVYRRQKHPFLSPPVTTLPGERFHEMMQDTLRGETLRALPFYDQKKVVALLGPAARHVRPGSNRLGPGVDAGAERLRPARALQIVRPRQTRH